MTKKETYVVIRNIVNASTVENKDDMLAFIDHEVELLNRKKSSSAQTAKQIENESIKELILDTLAENNEPMTISQLMKCEGLDYTNQRLSALMKQLVDTDKVVKTSEKRVSYFSLPSIDE